jgi:replication-associated recombination protein RarA
MKTRTIKLVSAVLDTKTHKFRAFVHSDPYTINQMEPKDIPAHLKGKPSHVQKEWHMAQAAKYYADVANAKHKASESLDKKLRTYRMKYKVEPFGKQIHISTTNDKHEVTEI